MIYIMSFKLIEMIMLGLLIDVTFVLAAISIYRDIKNKDFKLNKRSTWVKISVALLVTLNVCIFYTLL